MNHPVIASANGNERYNRMLKNAENFRRIKATSAPQPKNSIFGKFWELLTSLVPQEVRKSTARP